MPCRRASRRISSASASAATRSSGAGRRSRSSAAPASPPSSALIGIGLTVFVRDRLALGLLGLVLLEKLLELRGELIGRLFRDRSFPLDLDMPFVAFVYPPGTGHAISSCVEMGVPCRIFVMP